MYLGKLNKHLLNNPLLVNEVWCKESGSEFESRKMTTRCCSLTLFIKYSRSNNGWKQVNIDISFTI